MRNCVFLPIVIVNCNCSQTWGFHEGVLLTNYRKYDPTVWKGGKCFWNWGFRVHNWCEGIRRPYHRSSSEFLRFAIGGVGMKESPNSRSEVSYTGCLRAMGTYRYAYKYWTELCSAQWRHSLTCTYNWWQVHTSTWTCTFTIDFGYPIIVGGGRNYYNIGSIVRANKMNIIYVI